VTKAVLGERAPSRRYVLFPYRRATFLSRTYVLDVARTGPGSMEAVGSQGLPLPALGPCRSDLPGTATYHAVLVLEPADDEAGRELSLRFASLRM
jgi:hypothetical protein